MGRTVSTGCHPDVRITTVYTGLYTYLERRFLDANSFYRVLYSLYHISTRLPTAYEYTVIRSGM